MTIRGKYFTQGLILIAVLAMVFGCRDIIEVDIRKSDVQIFTPAKNSTSSLLRQTFDWADVDGARTYQVQCVQNSFDSAAIFVFDTIVKKSQLTYTMRVGTFEWRVRAKNNGYEGPYSTAKFRIDSTSTLAYQLIVLTSPTNGSYSNKNLQTLKWQDLSIADSFLVQIDTAGFIGSSIYQSRTIARNGSISNDDTLMANLPARQNSYQWRVKAKNKTSQTDYSSSWTFYIDQISPSAPTLVSPAYNTNVTASSTTLTWTRNATDISVDSLYVYRSDSITLLSGYPKQVSTNSSAISSLSRDSVYFWRVKSTDKAGNVGPFPVRRFKFKALF